MWNEVLDFFKRIKPYILPYAVAIAIPLTVGIVSAALTRGNMNIYEKLNTPPLSPPPFFSPSYGRSYTCLWVSVRL